MNYLGICLEYLRSVECNFSPLGVLSRGTQAYLFIFVFCFANRRLLFIFLGVHVSVFAFFAQETFIKIATEDFQLSNENILTSILSALPNEALNRDKGTFFE